MVNATCIGQYPDGLAVYTRHIVFALVRTYHDWRFMVYVNRQGADQLSDLASYSHVRLRTVTGRMAPEYGTIAHGIRWVFSQVLALRYPRSLFFAPSQLEIALYHGCQMVTFHDLIPLRFPAEHRRQVLFYRYFFGTAVRRAAAVIVPSIHTGSELRKQYHARTERVHVIHHGLPLHPQKIEANLSSADPYILYIGRLSPTKNIRGLIMAYQSIAHRIPHKLVIVGGGDRFRFHQMVSGGKSRVEFQGYVTPSRKLDMLRKADVFVFPSFDEGFGFPPLEAMACGCPVVVACAGSLPEICGAAAYYVDPYDPKNIAEGIYRVVIDRNIRSALIEKGFHHIQQFHWSDSVRHHADVISSVFSRRST